MLIESEISILLFQDYLSLFTNKKNILSTMAHKTVESECDSVMCVPIGSQTVCLVWKICWFYFLLSKVWTLQTNV